MNNEKLTNGMAQNQLMLDCDASVLDDLDLAIEFKNDIVILSNNFGYQTKHMSLDSYSLKNYVRNDGEKSEFLFHASKFIDCKKAVTRIYKLTFESDKKRLAIRDEIVTTATDNGLVFTLNGEQISVDDARLVKIICDTIRHICFPSVLITFSYTISHWNSV
mgnify:CR=1 FL=1